MGKHLDWSRITPDVAVWCKTEEEDLAFRQECEERGILWAAGARPLNFKSPSGLYIVDECLTYKFSNEWPTIPYSDLLVEDKPHVCEILGVEPGQPFICHGYPNRNYPPMVYQDGVVRLYDPAGQKRHKVGGQAITWMIDHPESVTPCLGYKPNEVAFTAKEDKPAKSRLAEILGVEDDEEWEYKENIYRIHDGKRQRKIGPDWCMSSRECDLAEMINNPSAIIRKPRFSPDELAMLRCFAAAGVTHIVREQTGKLRACEGSADKTPIDSSWIELGSVWAAKGHGMKETLLPSIRPGESVELSEVLK